MARGWLGAGILVVFLAIGFMVSGVMDNAHAPSCDLLDQAADMTLAGDFDGAVPLAMEAKARWEKFWNGTAVVADHSPMDDVDALFAEMVTYAESEEEPHFAACCRELSRRVQAVSGAHRFSWWNVL
ncbi:MAG: DUF4363 family protein [Oscillospiraceae bacterium]|nr:DUF4363 family protein [Oscillospiraceae bacterium]